jgi:hypothetical protein
MHGDVKTQAARQTATRHGSHCDTHGTGPARRIDRHGDLAPLLLEPVGVHLADLPCTASSSRPHRRRSGPRVRSTITVTALSARRRSCSDARCARPIPMALTADARFLMSIEVSACFLTAFGQVCASSPRAAAQAEGPLRRPAGELGPRRRDVVLLGPGPSTTRGRPCSVSPSHHAVDPDTTRRLTHAHLREPKFGRRCREPVAGSVPAVNVTKMGRTSTEEKHDG